MAAAATAAAMRNKMNAAALEEAQKEGERRAAQVRLAVCGTSWGAASSCPSGCRSLFSDCVSAGDRGSRPMAAAWNCHPSAVAHSSVKHSRLRTSGLATPVVCAAATGVTPQMLVTVMLWHACQPMPDL